VPGAFMSMIGNTLINDIVKDERIYDPGKVLTKLNKEVIYALNQGKNDFYSKQEKSNLINDGMDISLAVIDFENKKLKLSLANHIAMLINNDQKEIISGDIYSIGSVTQSSGSFEFKTIEINIEENMYLYMFSDGFMDQFGGEENKKYMSGRFTDLLLSIHKDAPEEQQSKLDSEFNSWKKNRKQLDDVLVAGIKLS